VAPILRQVTEHPFWAGLRTGTLASGALWYFAEQDTHHVVPTYARALARCAAVAELTPHASLLCSAAQATFGSLPRLEGELMRLAGEVGAPQCPACSAAGPAVHGYTSFMLAAPVTSFSAGLGGLLPMTWFHLWISQDLRRRTDPGSRYAAWIDQFCAYDGYEDYVAAYLGMVDDEAGRCSAGEWDQLVAYFSAAACYELAFADAAWHRQQWSA
jgi:thiaminase (transcriptional activator TenA)